MIVKYKVFGTIEVDLNKNEIDELQSTYTETLKKAFLEQLLYEKFKTCEITAEHELGVKINFEDLFIENDWSHAGNMKAKNEPYGSPLAIYVEDIPTTESEVVEQAINEIGNRKRNKKH